MQFVDKVKLLTALCSKMTGDQFKVAHVLLTYFHNSKTGECYPSYRQLAEISGTSPATAVAAIKALKVLGVVEFDPSNGGRNQRNSYSINVQEADRLIADVFNQTNTNVLRDEHGVQLSEHKRSNSRNAYINEKINEKTNEITHGSDRSARASMEAQFEGWWKTYPRRQGGKHEALKAYTKARKTLSAEELLTHAKDAAGIYAKTEERFIPYASTYLNQERWLDDKPKAKAIDPHYRGIL
jgi:DNA-binding transcriptional regulator YhcF (GntR family)